jgi:hypothetical protein
MEQLAHLPPQPKEIPDKLKLSTTEVDVRLTPNEMRHMREATGKQLTELLGEGAEESDRIQAIIWVKLRREGYELTWEQAGDILPEFEEPDPTSGDEPSSSPPSAGSGE